MKLKNLRSQTQFFLLFLLVLSACSIDPTSSPLETAQPPQPEDNATQIAPPTATSTPLPPRVLSICLGGEPGSLFPYSDSSGAARSVRSALYDGPIDVVDFGLHPAILENFPSIENGGASLQQVPVRQGDRVADAMGRVGVLEPGVLYRPAGCTGQDCVQEYTGEDENGGEDGIMMDQLVIRFRLLPDLRWSDGAPLTSTDALLGYDIALGLYPAVRQDLLAHTVSYQAVDERTVEWTGLPGYSSSRYQSFFFLPFPSHLWSGVDPQELRTLESANRSPVGWGPYVLEEWVEGDHITLKKNLEYHLAQQGLPNFDSLVFRFTPSPSDAVDALLAGECDIIDESVSLEGERDRLVSAQQQGQVVLIESSSLSWDQISLQISPLPVLDGDGLSPENPILFAGAETRRAIAQCVDREAVARAAGSSLPAYSYLHPDHPLYAAEAPQPTFDPGAASAALEAAGWIDADGDPTTPRTAGSVEGVLVGTPLRFGYLAADSEIAQNVAEVVVASLTQCGAQVEPTFLPWDELMAPGPDGPVFGRTFIAAEFAWASALEPPCFLFTGEEIPGPYPDFTRGWGGANITGYNNPEFDRACYQALNSLPESPEYLQAHQAAQQIFAAEVPAIPLYHYSRVVAARPDLCGLALDPSVENVLWNIELLDYGEGCSG